MGYIYSVDDEMVYIRNNVLHIRKGWRGVSKERLYAQVEVGDLDFF